jgi:hypothetical protein
VLRSLAVKRAFLLVGLIAVVGGCRSEAPREIEGSAIGPAEAVRVAPSASTRSSVPTSGFSFGAPTGSEPSVAVKTLCESSCAASAAAKCPRQSECVAQCGLLFGSSVCLNELTAMLKCMTKTSASDWECGPGGTPNLRETSCATEQSGAFSCLATRQKR